MGKLGVRQREQESAKAEALGISRYSLWRYRIGKRKPLPDLAKRISEVDREFRRRPRK